MKKDVAMFKKGVIVDFKGVEHPFIVCALSTSKYNNDEYSVSLDVIENSSLDVVGETDVPRAVFIGVSVCNPIDGWDENKGKMIAQCKAAGFKATKPFKSAALFATKEGLISTELVEALLNKEVLYIQENPESVIPGYTQMKERFETEQEYKKYLEESPEELRTLGEKIASLSDKEVERVTNIALIKAYGQ